MMKTAYYPSIPGLSDPYRHGRAFNVYYPQIPEVSPLEITGPELTPVYAPEDVRSGSGAVKYMNAKGFPPRRYVRDVEKRGEPFVEKGGEWFTLDSPRPEPNPVAPNPSTAPPQQRPLQPPAAAPPQQGGLLSQPMTMGLLNAGASLLANSGYSPVPITTGQALGQAMQAGLAGYGQGLEYQQKQAAAEMQRRLQSYQAKALERQQGLYENFGSIVDAFSGLTDEQKSRLKALGPEAGLPILQELQKRKFAGNTKVISRIDPGTKMRLVYAQDEFGNEEFKQAFPEPAPSVTKIGNRIYDNRSGKLINDQPNFEKIQLGSELNAALGREAYRPNSYYITNPETGQPELVDKQAFGDERILLQDFQRSNAGYQQVASAIENIQQLEKSGTGFADHALIIFFQKTLDPNSAVMQGEFDAAAARQGIVEKYSNLFQNWTKGQILTTTAKAELREAATNIAKVLKRSAEANVQTYQSLADDNLLSLQLENPFKNVDLDGSPGAGGGASDQSNQASESVQFLEEL